jgi:hypothetical protein
MGNIYGVTFTSAIVQNLLLARLPDVLGTAANDEVRGFAPISELMSFHRR